MSNWSCRRGERLWTESVYMRQWLRILQNGWDTRPPKEKKNLMYIQCSDTSTKRENQEWGWNEGNLREKPR